MIIVFLFVALLFIGVPIAISIGILSVVGISQLGTAFLPQIPAKIYGSLDSFVFLAMPLFILSGEIMNKTEITHRLVSFAKALVGHYKGGLAQSNMLASIFFAGITGSATADAATFGRTLVPAMEREGYTRAYSCAVTAAGSIIGPTIPPSSLMILYGSLMGVSISGLFAAGILPGLLIGFVCMLIIQFSRKDLPRAKHRASWAVVVKEFRYSLLCLFMPIIVLGCIITGFVSPTEASAIAVAYALFLGAGIYKKLSWKDIPELIERTTVITASVFLIVACAGTLGWWLSFMRIPQEIASVLLSFTDNKNLLILLIIGLLMLFGAVMDIAAILILLGPIIVPITNQIGMDPIQAGIMIVLALNISLMTPPVGACLFVLSSTTGEKIGNISRELTPFLIGEFLVLLAVAYYQDLTTAIPRLLGL